MRAAIVLGLALAAVTASGCDSTDGSQHVPDQPVGSRTASTAATAPGTVQYRDEDLAVPPDFEAEADEQITEENYEQKLAEIEDEMGERPDAGADAGSKTDAGAPPDAAAKPGAPARPAAPGKPPSGGKPPTKPPAPAKPKGDDAYD